MRPKNREVRQQNRCWWVAQLPSHRKEIGTMKTYNFCAGILRWTRAPWPRDARGTGTWIVLAAATLAMLFASCCNKKALINAGLLPIADKVTPATIAAGSPDTPITIEGMNFNS